MQAIILFPNISPDIVSIQLGGMTFALRWYALAYIVGILLAWRIVAGLARRPGVWPAGKAPYGPEQAEEFLTWAILGVILGGRLGFVLFYQPAYYLGNPVEILKVWNGGMSFHGGFLGVVLAAILFARRQSIPLANLSDALALAVTPGLFLGRVANFINAELWGRPSDAPWAVIFPGAAAQDCPGVLTLCARHPSQLYEAGMEGLILGATLWLLMRRGWLATPWALTGVFLAGYGIARFVVEFFRQADGQFITPDNPLGHVFLGLSMGQLLSVPMILIGLAVVLAARRRG